MSYRNPTYYGIVEDMSAFTDAFQSTFGEIKKSIDANIAAKKERDNSLSLARAKGIEKINKEAENVPLKLMDDYKNYFNSRIDAMGDYDTLDPVYQTKFFGDIENMARFANEIGNISNNLDDYDGVPEDMKTAVRKWGLSQLDSSVSEKGIMIGDYSISTIVNAFANASKLSGNKDSAAAIKEDISKNALKKLEAAQEKAGRDLEPKEIESVIKQHVSDSAELVKNPDNDFVWKYVMDDEDKNLKKLIMPIGVSEDINMSSLNYNLSDLQKFDDKVLKTGENLRDMLIANYYTKSLSSSIGSQLKPYKKPGGGEEEEEVKIDRSLYPEIDKLELKLKPAIGPAEEGRPLIDFDDLEPKLSQPPYFINTKKAEKVGGREARIFTKSVAGADRTVTIYENATEEEIKLALKFLETGESLPPSNNYSTDPFGQFEIK